MKGKEDEYASMRIAMKKTGQTSRTIKNYVDVGCVETQKIGKEKEYRLSDIPKRQLGGARQGNDQLYVKMFFELTAILEDYIPLAGLSETQFESYQNRVVAFLKKCDKMNKEA